MSSTPAVPGDPWASFALDPREAVHARLRAGDRDRDVVAGWLAEAFADGRLDREEYDERSTTLAASKTLGELPPLVTDLLPSSPTAVRRIAGGDLAQASHADLERMAHQDWLEHVRNAAFGFASLSIIMWVVWIFSGFGFPWPIFPTVVVGLNVGRALSSRASYERDALRRLEKKQRRQLKPPEQPMGDE